VEKNGWTVNSMLVVLLSCDYTLCNVRKKKMPNTPVETVRNLCPKLCCQLRWVTADVADEMQWWWWRLMEMMIMVVMMVEMAWWCQCCCAVDDTPPFTFPRHVHNRDSLVQPREESVSPGVVGPTLTSRPAYHSSSARSLNALQHSAGKG